MWTVSTRLRAKSDNFLLFSTRIIWCSLTKIKTEIKSWDNKTIRSWNLYVLKSTEFRCPVLPRRTVNFLFALLGFIIFKPNPKHHGCPVIVFFFCGSGERSSRLNLLCPRSKNLFVLSSPVGKDRQKASKIFWTWPNYTPSKMPPWSRFRWAPK